MFYEDLEEKIQERYPMIRLRWNSAAKALDVIEHHGGADNNGERFLWRYQNSDGTNTPVIYDTLLNWLLKADTRHWSNHRRGDLFKKYVENREKQAAKTEKEFENAMQDRIVEDYNYIAGIKTFFMDPTSMPLAKTDPYALVKKSQGL